MKTILDRILQPFNKAILDRKIQAAKAKIQADDELMSDIRKISRDNTPPWSKSGNRSNLEQEYQSAVAEKEAWIVSLNDKQTAFLTKLNEQLTLLQNDARPWQQAISAGWIAVGKVAILVTHLSGIKERPWQWEETGYDFIPAPPPGKEDYRLVKMKEVQSIAREIVELTEKFSATVAEIDNKAAIEVNCQLTEAKVFGNNYVFERDILFLIDNIEDGLKLLKSIKNGLQAVVDRLAPRSKELSSRVTNLQAEKNRVIENY